MDTIKTPLTREEVERWDWPNIPASVRDRVRFARRIAATEARRELGGVWAYLASHLDLRKPLPKLRGRKNERQRARE